MWCAHTIGVRSDVSDENTTELRRLYLIPRSTVSRLSDTYIVYMQYTFNP